MPPAVRLERARFDGIVTQASSEAAVHWVEQALEDGADPLDVLDVIADVQRTVGDRWAEGVWTVAQEHAATVVSAAAVATVDRLVEVPAGRGHVLLACADQEWHELPASMVAAALRSGGWQVTMLGSSTSPVRFSQAIQDLDPDVTAVSCSLLGALPAARRFIEASTAAGVPVIAGGAAFGQDDSRARRLGATLWAADARHALAVLQDAPTVVDSIAPLDPEPARERATLELAQPELTRTLGPAWGAMEPTTSVDRGRDLIRREVVQQVLGGLAASLMTGEPGPLRQAITWSRALLDARDLALGQLDVLHNLLAVELRDYPLAQAMVVQHWT